MTNKQMINVHLHEQSNKCKKEKRCKCSLTRLAAGFEKWVKLHVGGCEHQAQECWERASRVSRSKPLPPDVPF